MLRGLTTVSYYADDMESAERWYTTLLGLDPYFKRPVDGPAAYLEYRIGDYQLLSMGATEHEPQTDREAGFVTAWAVDPFGNILGVMYNPHYLAVLGATKPA